MNQMNQIVIEGNVVRDTQIRETARGTRVCMIPIATNRFYRDMKGSLQKETAFFDVEAWGENFCKTAVKMAKKGRGLRVVGRLKQDRWKNSEGKAASKIYIVAEHIDFKPEKTAENKSGTESASAAEETDSVNSDYSEISNEFMDGGETVF